MTAYSTKKKSFLTMAIENENASFLLLNVHSLSIVPREDINNSKEDYNREYHEGSEKIYKESIRAKICLLCSFLLLSRVNRNIIEFV